VVLTERQEALIDALVRTGRYQNASEVLREGLRLIEQREAEDAAKLEALQKAAEIGWASFERGEVRAFTSAKALSRHLKNIAAKAMSAPKRG
jgi:antitoxin ParD1/3/4